MGKRTEVNCISFHMLYQDTSNQKLILNSFVNLFMWKFTKPLLNAKNLSLLNLIQDKPSNKCDNNGYRRSNDLQIPPI